MSTLTKARVLVTRFPYESRMGGEEVHTLSVVRGLRKKAYEFVFMGSCPVLLKEFRKEGIPTKKARLLKPPVTKVWLILFTLASPFLFFWAGWLLWRARRTHHVNVLYALSLGEKLLMTPWALLFGMKVLWWEHARIGPWLTRNPWRLFYQFWSRWVKILVTSEAMKEPLSFAKNVLSTPCGVELSTPEPLPLSTQAFMKDHFTVGTVARLTPDKGVDKLVRAVQSLEGVKLVIVGEGPLKEALSANSSPGTVCIIDSLSRGQIHQLYLSLDVFVLPSTEMDPFGMVAAEAMLAGSPTIVSSKCGISKTLTDGENALICEPNLDGLAQAIQKLQKDSHLSLKLSTAGPLKVLHEDSVELMLKYLEQLI